MAPRIVISYDGTPDDDDAIALGAVFARAGASVSLAYVRHSHLTDAKAEERESRAADALLARGIDRLGTDANSYVLFDPSTASALIGLLEREGGDMIVFGSSYRTPAGHVAPGRAAETLLDRGPAAVALAPAGMRDVPAEIDTIGLQSGPSDDAAGQTAESLAASLGARVLQSPDPHAGLLVIASRPDASLGQVSISAASELLAEAARCPVLVIANGSPLTFALPSAADVGAPREAELTPSS